MKKLFAAMLLSSAALSACTYAVGGVSTNGQVVIAKNDGFLFGLLNKVFVCNVTPGGVASCAASETP